MRLASFIASAAGGILVLLCSISDVAAQSRERSGWYVGGGIGSNWASDIDQEGWNQNSAVWAGTPLFLSHISQDGRFLATESPYACGWIDLRDIAYVDEEFVAKYRSANLAAVGRDRIPISSDRTGFLFQGRIGMLLPMATGAETGVHLLAPVADASRRASMTHVRLLDRDAAPFPLPSSEDQLAKVINEILGQPYGWGGLGGYRDCSSTMAQW